MSNLIRIAESDDFIVDYDRSRGMYRVSVFANYHWQDELWFDAYDEKELPRKTGYWIDKGYEVECSECGHTCNDEYYLGEEVACPNCGTLMNNPYSQRLKQ